MTYDARILDLRSRLRSLPGAVVAFSGGVDSAMLLHACAQELGARVLAATADSPSLPRAELAEARDLADELAVRHAVIHTHELERADYRRNGSDRCFYCKDELFETIAQHLDGESEASWPVLYGAIADDLTDHRPGARAARERGVLAPLADAGLSKEDVRRYSREHGLRTADKPALACLASRVPYGTSIDGDLLGRVEAAEAVLHRLGYRQFRVRHHGDVARVELEPADLSRAVGQDREAILAGLRGVGYTWVAIDLAGYRSGSMNETLGRNGS